MSRSFRLTVLIALLAGLGLCASARAQVAAGAPKDALLSLIPPKAVFFLERRGHEAVREVFLKSNLGKMAQDQAINEFVHATRVRIGQMIVKGMFDLTAAEDVAAHQKLLHEVLKPFWYNPCAMYVVLDPKFDRAPGAGFICMVGAKYRKGCADSLAKLMKVGVAETGEMGTRQAFTYRSGMITWNGVAKRHQAFKLPDDKAERVKQLKKSSGSLFLVSWTLPTVLLVATDLKAADAMGEALANPGKAWPEKAGFKAVAAKTAVKDWAFRWHFDAAAMIKMARTAVGEDASAEINYYLAALGVDKVRGVGGTGGYVDNVYVRKTYISAPGTDRGILKLFRPGASYKAAHAMVPSESTFALAGRLDTKVLFRMIRECVSDKDEDEATGKTVRKVPEEAEKMLKPIEQLAAASTEDVGGFVLDLQAMVMGGGGPGGFPAGVVLGLKDRDKAIKAIDELVKLAGGGEEVPARLVAPVLQHAGGGPAKPVKPTAYRKIEIRYAGEMIRFAVLKDRVLVAFGDTALKAGIDAALDNTGGFDSESRTGMLATRLAKPLEKGAVIFKMDLAALAGLGWPLLMQLVQANPEEVPFASLPSTNKMVRMLGPELAVIIGDKDGLLLSSRGKIPFATKIPLIYPMAGGGIFYLLMR